MTQATRPTRTIRIPPDELDAVIHRLQETSCKPHEGAQKRASQRQALHLRNVPIEVVQPGGDVAGFLVDTYSLSSGGVGFVHGGFVHIGSPCLLRLATVDNAWEDLRGRVVRCRHLERGLHDVGVQWTDLREPLDLARFIGSSALRLRVLLVEDHPAMRELAQRYLRRGHAEVTCAATCQDARSAFARGGWDAAVLDIELPDGSGMDLVREWREQGEPTYLIACTASTSPEDRTRIMASGFDAFVGKPYTAEQFLAAMCEVASEPLVSSLGNDSDIADLVKVFVNDLPKLVAGVKKTLESKDYPAARPSARQLRASAVSYGFQPIADAAAQLDECLSAATVVEHEAWRRFGDLARLTRRAQAG